MHSNKNPQLNKIYHFIGITLHFCRVALKYWYMKTIPEIFTYEDVKGPKFIFHALILINPIFFYVEAAFSL